MKRSLQRTTLKSSLLKSSTSNTGITSTTTSSSTTSSHPTCNQSSLVSHQQVRHAGSNTFWNDKFHERYEPDELDKHYGVKTKPQYGGAWNLAVIATASAMVFIFFAVRRYWGQFLGIDHGHHHKAYYDTESDEQDEWWDIRDSEEEIETRMEAILARGFRSEQAERFRPANVPYYKDRIQRSLGFSE